MLATIVIGAGCGQSPSESASGGPGGPPAGGAATADAGGPGGPDGPGGGPPDLSSFMPPATVVTATVAEGAFVQPIRLTGDVQPFERTIIAAEGTGIVDVIMADAGDEVTSGTPLARLRLLPLQAAYQVSKARADQENQRYMELRNGSRPEDIAVSKASWLQAQANTALAKTEFDRFRTLLEQRSVSQSEFDVRQTQYESARALEEAAKATYDRALAGERTEVIAAQAAAARGASAEATVTRDRLERATFRAPYDGVITRRHVSPGAWVDSGDPLYEIEHLETVRVIVNVPEYFFADVAVGQAMEVTFDGIPRETFRGTITRRIPAADPTIRAFPIRVDIDNSDGRLASGMLARVLIKPTAAEKRSKIVPKDALAPMGPQLVVFRANVKGETATAEPVPVETGRFFGQSVEVFGELAAGDSIVVRGNERLMPGQKIILNSFLTNQATAEIFDRSRFFEEERLRQLNGRPEPAPNQAGAPPAAQPNEPQAHGNGHRN